MNVSPEIRPNRAHAWFVRSLDFQSGAGNRMIQIPRRRILWDERIERQVPRRYQINQVPGDRIAIKTLLFFVSYGSALRESWALSVYVMAIEAIGKVNCEPRRW